MIERALVAERVDSRPRHVAIVMEGMDGWARSHRRSAAEGDRAGAAALRETVRSSAQHGIEILTVHARSEGLARAFAANESDALQRANVRLRTLGRVDAASPATREALAAAVAATADASGMVLNVAVQYSARAELCDAVRALARDVRGGTLGLGQIDDEILASYLYTHGLPDPDLLIRTGGELRLSDFLLYQIAYSELWSTPTLWPNFDESDLLAALGAFSSRQRRFGS